MTDTHCHLYDTAFDGDRDQAIARAKEAGITHILMPAIDSKSHRQMLDTARSYPDICIPMMGLHPTSVNENPDYKQELALVERLLADEPAGTFCAVGEVGLDLYWSKDYLEEQSQALVFQAGLALRHNLPLVIHCRQAWPELVSLLTQFKGRGLKGVMHAFSGSCDEYTAMREIGDFYVGIGGPVTYKKSLLPEVLPRIPLEHIVLETDAPYLPPVPYRGKRNESAYTPLICDRVAGIMGLTSEEIERQTNRNARTMFAIEN